MAKYCDMDICDLRYLTDPEAIRQIDGICDVDTLILPKDASPEVAAAFAAIPKSDIDSIQYLPTNAEMRNYNGVLEINNDAPIGRAVYYTVNGVCIINDLQPDADITIRCNGLCILNKKLRGHNGIHFDAINGMTSYLECENYKIYPNAIEFNAERLSYLPDHTLLIVGNKLTLKPDVTVELLRAKDLQFLVGNIIFAPQSLLAYLTATATVGNKISALEEQTNKDRE